MNRKLVTGAMALLGAVAISAPAMAGKHHHHHGHHARYWHQWQGHHGMSVAAGGGVYSARDVAAESPRRMSHPGIGSPFAPSFVVRGSHAYINRYEMALTARLNLAQINR